MGCTLGSVRKAFLMSWIYWKWFLFFRPMGVREIEFKNFLSLEIFQVHSKKPVLEGELRPTLDEGPGSNFLKTNLDWFETDWILWVGLYLGSLAWFLVLQIKSSPFSTVFWSEPIWFSLQNRFSLNLPLFGLGPWSEGLGTNLKLLTNKIA